MNKDVKVRSYERVVGHELIIGFNDLQKLIKGQKVTFTFRSGELFELTGKVLK